MEKNPLADALDRVRLLAATGRFADLSDGALLDRCVTGRDEAAFAELVERHGAMVYGVCSRVLRDPHDTEDACQATFMVLARKAGDHRAIERTQTRIDRIGIRLIDHGDPPQFIQLPQQSQVYARRSRLHRSRRHRIPRFHGDAVEHRQARRNEESG